MVSHNQYSCAPISGESSIIDFPNAGENFSRVKALKIPARGNKLNKCFLVLVILFYGSCVKYTFKGALPSNFKTIAIPLFEDRSRWVGLQEELTQSVIDAFIQDNTFEVIEDESNSDLLLMGNVLGVNSRKTTIRSGEVVDEEQLYVNVKIECINQLTEKPLWSATVSDFALISGNATLSEREAAVDEAVEKIVAEILNRTLGAW